MKTTEPYQLAGNCLFFTNWHFIKSQKGSSWGLASGEYPGIMSSYDPKSQNIVWNVKDQTKGIRIRLEKAEKIGPIFQYEKPWEKRGLSATILKDQGIYRAWCTTGWHYEHDNPENHLCYLESEDGFFWKRPDCCLVDYHGDYNNNLLTHRQGWQLHNGGVFIDPHAPESEKYKWLNEEIYDQQEIEQFFPDISAKLLSACDEPIYYDPRSRLNNGLFLGIRGGSSPDGLKWEFFHKPLALVFSDTHTTAYYDSHLKKYVGYFRDWIGDKRVISRSESDDFRKFNKPEIVITTSLDDSPNCHLYTNCRTTMPDAPDHHLMFPTVWDTDDDTTRVNMASSHDGKVWQAIPGGPVLETSESGRWDGGCLFAYPDLFEMPGGDFVLPYTGYDVPHKYPRGLATRNVGYAVWRKGRIIGIEASDYGEFLTIPVVPPGKLMKINASTKRCGCIRFEICRPGGEPIPGREMKNAHPLTGDCHWVQAGWSQCDSIWDGLHESVSIRVSMEHAKLYGLQFSD